MSKKFQKSADFLEICRQCPRIFCPLLGTVRYWELLLNKSGREAEFCPLLGAFPLLGSALLGALSVVTFPVPVNPEQENPILCTAVSIELCKSLPFVAKREIHFQLVLWRLFWNTY